VDDADRRVQGGELKDRQQLVKRFVCARCGATAPLSARPFQECGSCSAVSDFDFGAARSHPDWPAHEAKLQALWAQRHGTFEKAHATGDREQYAKTYADLLKRLVGEFPQLYPSRATDAAYAKHLVAFYANWQATAAIEPELANGNQTAAMLRAVALKKKNVRMDALWPLIDHTAAHFKAQQRIAAAIPPGPPDDFVPDFIVRWGTSITIAEWLPKLIGISPQRTLVERMGVSREYVEPHHNEIRCPNCGGAVPVEHGFGKIPCPYCSAEIQEPRDDHAKVEASRAAYAEAEDCLRSAEHEAHERIQRIQVLDGEVERDGKRFRMIVLRACFPKRSEDFYEAFDMGDGGLAEMLAWADTAARARSVSCERVPFREHPKFAGKWPPLESELDARLAETAPGASVALIRHGVGDVVEVVVGGTIVRLAHDKRGNDNTLLTWWRAQRDASNSRA
jgi:hypothetical protein